MEKEIWKHIKGFKKTMDDVECNRETKINIIRRIRAKSIYKEILSNIK